MKYTFSDGIVYSNIAEEQLDDPMIQHGYLGVMQNDKFKRTLKTPVEYLLYGLSATHYVIMEEPDNSGSIMVVYPVEHLVKVEP